MSNELDRSINMATNEGNIVNEDKMNGILDTVEHAETTNRSKPSPVSDTLDEDPHTVAASESTQSLTSLSPITFVAVFVSIEHGSGFL